MKKNLIAFICLLVFYASASAGVTVSDKVLKSFNETFPKAEQVKWQEFADNYVVNFLVTGIRARISYDKDGNFLSATRYYTEENLPVSILCKIRKKYPGQQVFGVTEVEVEGNVDYYVKLQDETNWTTVKASQNGAMEQVEKYKRAPE